MALAEMAGEELKLVPLALRRPRCSRFAGLALSTDNLFKQACRL